MTEKIHTIDDNSKEDINKTDDSESMKTISLSTSSAIPERMRSNSIFNTVISHRAVLILLQSTLLIYNYGKTFTTNHPGETIETFVNNAINDGSIHKIGLNDTRKTAIMELKEIAPNGRVHTFIDDPISDIQIGITINDEQQNNADLKLDDVLATIRFMLFDHSSGTFVMEVKPSTNSFVFILKPD